MHMRHTADRPIKPVTLGRQLATVISTEDHCLKPILTTIIARYSKDNKRFNKWGMTMDFGSWISGCCAGVITIPNQPTREIVLKMGTIEGVHLYGNLIEDYSIKPVNSQKALETWNTGVLPVFRLPINPHLQTDHYPALIGQIVMWYFITGFDGKMMPWGKEKRPRSIRERALQRAQAGRDQVQTPSACTM